MNAQLKPEITVQRERYSEALCQELLPLLKDNWVRTESLIGAEPMDPAWDKYQKLDEMDLVECITARRNGELVGYIIYFLSLNMHHKTVRSAHGDLLYVKRDPGLGRVVFALIDAAEMSMRARGIKYVGWFVQKGSRVRKILESRGYIDDEIVMEKKLCAQEQTS
jgi:hypothetical protein